MLSFKNHLFAVEAFFDYSLVLTFAVPKPAIEHLIPPCLKLDAFNEQWAFIAVAMVQTTELRPKGLPRIFGNDFFLIGYRVFVRYTNNEGKNLRGLYILRSETNKRKMEVLGTIFTRYNYTTTDIQDMKRGDRIAVSSVKSNFKVVVEKASHGNAKIPSGSPFQDWKEARRFAGPLPFTFSYDPQKRQVLIVEGVRENWKPEPVNVLTCEFSFFEEMNLHEVKLASAFIIENSPYHWKKGKIEKWQQ